MPIAFFSWHKLPRSVVDDDPSNKHKLTAKTAQSTNEEVATSVLFWSCFTDAGGIDFLSDVSSIPVSGTGE